ncbi:MAG: aconitate hydratase [Arcobacter sp.]|nr:aconitate hydratase [Arcobacter sp.]|tara:strand:- start:13885 stop:15069 length:1185 start_codon:yes stop_codon:yes gene_type:complete
MILKVFNDDGTTNEHKIEKELFYDEKLEEKISYISSSNKEENALKIFQSYFSNAKSILFDNTNKAIVKQLEELNIKEFREKDFSFIYFTSGTTGFPVGALKTNENILEEIKVLSRLFKKYAVKRVIVTVPFIHFYGSLMGLMYPLFNDIDIILKEHFLPSDLLDLIDDNSLVITTPLYIKSLNRVNEVKDLSKSIFLSSTAPLMPNIAKEFNEKFSSNIIQLFGSTETGGISYKYNDESLWTPLEKVETFVNELNELKVKSPFISNILFEKTFKTTNSEIQTFDYVEFEDSRFKLVGRSSQILKVAGKRYSTIQIEHILEDIKDIRKAVVFVNSNKDALRGESLEITIESDKEFLVKDIKQILKKELSNIKFSITLKIVDKIKTTAIGKKIAIE